MRNLNRKGFTMVELLIVLAIIAILAAIAIPVYSAQLEVSRKKVDESNLRAATGLATQAILLADPGLAPGQLVWENRRYLVFTYEDAVKDKDDKATAKNMLVYRDSGTIDEDGNWYEDPTPTASLPTGKKLAFTTKGFSFKQQIPDWTKGTGDLVVTEKKAGSGMIGGKKVVAYPLQQNGGNARFSIVVSRKGEVVESKILTDRKIKVDW